MGFMELEIETGIWINVEDKHGEGATFPGDLIGRTTPGDLTPEDLVNATDYGTTATAPVRGTAVHGTAWRLSAPGYLDCTEWTLADGGEDAAFREAVDLHDLCAECGSTDCAEDSSFCKDCVSPDAIIIDTALSTDGHHDVLTGGSFLVRFGDLGDVIVSDRYTRAISEDVATDIAIDVMVEMCPDMFRDPEESLSDQDEHRVLTERAADAVESVAPLATRYANGKR